MCISSVSISRVYELLLSLWPIPEFLFLYYLFEAKMIFGPSIVYHNQPPYFITTIYITNHVILCIISQYRESHIKVYSYFKKR
jgi:hypothetical protein